MLISLLASSQSVLGTTAPFLFKVTGGGIYSKGLFQFQNLQKYIRNYEKIDFCNLFYGNRSRAHNAILVTLAYFCLPGQKGNINSACVNHAPAAYIRNPFQVVQNKNKMFCFKNILRQTEWRSCACPPHAALRPHMTAVGISLMSVDVYTCAIKYLRPTNAVVLLKCLAKKWLQAAASEPWFQLEWLYKTGIFLTMTTHCNYIQFHNA